MKLPAVLVRDQNTSWIRRWTRYSSLSDPEVCRYDKNTEKWKTRNVGKCPTRWPPCRL